MSSYNHFGCNWCGFPFNGGNCPGCSSAGSRNEFVYDPNPYSYNETPNFFNQPQQYQYETYSCELCEGSPHCGFDCQTRTSLVYEQDPCNNQNFSNDQSPYYSMSLPQQFNCCEVCGGPHYSSDCQAGNTPIYDQGPHYSSDYQTRNQLVYEPTPGNNYDFICFYQPLQHHIDQSTPQDLDFESNFNILQRDTNRILEELLRTLKPNPPVGEPEGSDHCMEVPFDDEQICRHYYIAQVTPLVYTPPPPFLTTMEPTDTLLMGVRESEVTSDSNLECDMPDNTPFPATNVREEKFYINSPLAEQLVDFLMKNEDVAGLPRHLVKRLFSHLVKDLSSTKRMSDEPSGDNSKPISYDVTFSNSLFDFNDDYTLCYDNLLFDEEFEDISSLDPSKSAPFSYEPLDNPDSMSRSLKTSNLNLEELTAKIGLDDLILTELMMGGKTRVMETPSFGFHYMPSPHPAAYSSKEAKELKIYLLDPQVELEPVEVINNGNKVFKKTVGTVEQTYELTTAEEKLDKRNEKKAKGTLLMALPNKDQLKFYSYQDEKLLMEAIEKSTSSTNKADTTAGGVSTAHTQGNTVNSTSVDNFSDVMICAFHASQPNSPQLAKEDLKQINPDDLEEMDLRWEMAMLTIRARSSDSEVDSCSKTCMKANANLKEEYDSLTSDYKKYQFNLLSYKAGLQSIEERLVHYKKNEAVFTDKINILNLKIKLRDNALVEYTKNLEKAEKKRDELNLTLEKLQNSSKSLNNLLDSQVSDKFKTGLGYKEITPNSFVNSFKVLENQENVESRLDKGYHAVPPPFVDVISNIPPSDVKTVESKHKTVDINHKVLTRSGKINTTGASVTTAVRPVNTAGSKSTINHPRLISKAFKRGHSQDTRPFNKYSTNKSSVFNNKKGNPLQKEYKEKGVIDSGCSRHMIGNKCYLTDFEAYDGGFVSFGDGKGRISSKGKIKTGKLDFDHVYFCKELKYNLFSMSQMCDKKNNVLFIDTQCLVLSSNFKLLDESQVLLRVPRKDNIYSVDLKSVVPTGGLTCLFAKATLDESNLWHRRLGHINYKTMNKLVKGNLMRGKFEGKADEGYFVGYSVVSKAMRVFNKRTSIVEETLNIRFLENAPNVKANGPDWLFDIDSLTISMNYVPVVARNQTNGIAGSKENLIEGTKDSIVDAGKKATKVDESKALDNGGQDDQPRSEVESLL
nr:ribonuclease H-like domain-containing protein [Tanacetum cinerariifolium]